jgi:UDP-glucose 4-epimerase
MRILVTGGAGFIASHLVDLLIESGHTVSIVDNFATGRRSNLNPKATFYEVDIRDAEALRRVFEAERPEVVDHHAAQMDVRRSVADPIFDANVNVVGGLNLLNLAVEFGTRKFIHISSGGTVYGEPVYLPADEKHPIQPECPYGVTKFALEMYLNVYKHIHNLDYSVLRYPNVYGPRQDPFGEAGVVAIFTKRMMKNEPVTIFGDGEQLRDYVYVGDCARANLMLLEQGSGEPFNLGSASGTSVNTLFHELKALIGYQQDAIYAPARAGEIYKTYLDASKARQAFGWEPTVSLTDGLGRTVNYFRQVEAESI